MPYDRFRHHRRSIRLRDYDYTRAGAYFITIRAAQPGYVFGIPSGGGILLNDLGRLADDCWQAIPSHFSGVRLDAWVVMPDHVHGILVLPHGVPGRCGTDTGMRRTDDDDTGANILRPYIMGDMGDGLPSNRDRWGASCALTRRLSRASPIAMLICSAFAWQRNYYERIIWNGRELYACRRYIRNNPLHL